MDFNNILNSLNQIQGNYQEQKQEFDAKEFVASVGMDDSKVTVTANGAQQILNINLSEEFLVKNTKMTLDLVCVAVNKVLKEIANDTTNPSYNIKNIMGNNLNNIDLSNLGNVFNKK